MPVEVPWQYLLYSKGFVFWVTVSDNGYRTKPEVLHDLWVLGGRPNKAGYIRRVL